MTSTAAVPTDPPVDLWSPRLRAMTVGSVALVSLLAFEALAVGTAMPTVARSLDGLGLYALAFGGPFASSVVAMVASGIWCDARGPRPAMWHGVVWFVAGLVVAGAATTMEVLVVGRVVQGFGSGLVSVALYVVVGQAYPEQLRRRIFAAFAAAWVVPSLVGPALAGLIVEHLGWRWVFLAVPAVAIPAALLVQPGLRALTGTVATRPPAGALARLGWACGAGASAALLHYGGQQRGALAAGLIAAALAGLLACVPHLLPAGFLRAARGLPTVIGLRALASAAFVAAEVVIPLMLSRERGFSPTGAGLVLTVGALSWSVGSWIQGRISSPRSAATLPRAGLACITIGTAGVASALLPELPVLPAVLSWSVAGLGMGLLYPSLSVLTLAHSAPAEQGRNSSALQLGDSLAAATVLALTGAVLAANSSPGPAGYATTLAVAAVCGLLGLAVAGRVVPRPTP